MTGRGGSLDDLAAYLRQHRPAAIRCSTSSSSPAGGDHEIRWISVGLRCLTDGTLGVYTDWKIDYTPTAHLLAGA